MATVSQGSEIFSPDRTPSFAPYYAHLGCPGGGRIAQAVDARRSCITVVGEMLNDSIPAERFPAHIPTWLGIT